MFGHIKYFKAITWKNLKEKVKKKRKENDENYIFRNKFTLIFNANMKIQI